MRLVGVRCAEQLDEKLGHTLCRISFVRNTSGLDRHRDGEADQQGCKSARKSDGQSVAPNELAYAVAF